MFLSFGAPCRTVKLFPLYSIDSPCSQVGIAAVPCARFRTQINWAWLLFALWSRPGVGSCRRRGLTRSKPHQIVHISPPLPGNQELVSAVLQRLSLLWVTKGHLPMYASAPCREVPVRNELCWSLDGPWKAHKPWRWSSSVAKLWRNRASFAPNSTWCLTQGTVWCQRVSAGHLSGSGLTNFRFISPYKLRSLVTKHA